MTDATPAEVPNRWHTCPGLHSLTAPLIREGVRAKVEAIEREEYLGKEVQRTGDDGKPYMAVKTTRKDGEDLAVNAGLARGSLGDAWDAGIGLIGPSDE
jgi:hypothetical protein